MNRETCEIYVDDWLNEIKAELNLQIKEKSNCYNFDFDKDEIKSDKTSNFD